MSRERSELGEVLSAEGRHARVKMQPGTHCAACSCAGLCTPFGKDGMVVAAENPLGAIAGQKVRITYRAEAKAKASLILYIIPVLALLIGAALGSSIDPFHNPDLSAVAAGLVFLCLSFWRIRGYAARKYGRDPSYQPTISHVLPDSEPPALRSAERPTETGHPPRQTGG
jgi:sigma-E factor negative regulatory protein RseC